MKTELYRTERSKVTMGEVLSIQMPNDIIKRLRPAEWIVMLPPAKRMKTFHEDGAKAPKLDKIAEVS